MHNHEKEPTMKPQVITALVGTYALLLGIGALAHAQEAKGPTQFNLAIFDWFQKEQVGPTP